MSTTVGREGGGAVRRLHVSRGILVFAAAALVAATGCATRRVNTLVWQRTVTVVEPATTQTTRNAAPALFVARKTKPLYVQQTVAGYGIDTQAVHRGKAPALYLPQSEFPEGLGAPDGHDVYQPPADLLDQTDLLAKADLGVCFSGGGTRSASATIGELRGLQAIELTNGVSLLSRVRYISAVSGGSWAATPYVFLPTEFDDADFLGPYRGPDELTTDDFTWLYHSRSNALYSAAHSHITWRYFGNLLLRWRGDETYSDTLTSIFLKPVHLGETRFFTQDGTSLNRILKQNGGRLSSNDFYVARTGRPFLIVGATISQKDWYDDYSPYRNIHFEMTPLYVGSSVLFCYAGRHFLPVTFWNIPLSPDHLPIGGGYVEPFAYDSVRPRTNQGPVYTATLKREGHHFTHPQFTLGDMIAASGAAPSFFPAAGHFGFPEFRHWSPAAPTNFPALEYLHADGGVLENTGIMPLLARGVSNIIVFVNAEKPFTPDYPEKEGTISDTVAALFGCSENRAFSHQFNQVFEKEEFTNLVKALTARKDEGRPLVYTHRYKVRAQPHYGIRAYDANVVWYYLGPMRRQSTDRNLWIESLVKRGVWDAIDRERDLKRFPHYATFLENGDGFADSSIIDLSRIQANALAHFTAWCTKESEDDILACFGRQNLLPR